MEVKADFDVTGWEEGSFDEETQSADAVVRKTFRGGIEGTSVARLRMAGSDSGRGYVASELFTGAIAGRRGTLIMQHGGLDDGKAPFTFGNIVPFSGTGELAGLTGTVNLTRDETGHHTIAMIVDGL